MAKNTAKETSGETAAASTAKDITIQGVVFTVTQPYAEGHTCSAAEAAALNQTRSENIRNNKAGDVKKAKTEAGEGNELAKDVLTSLAQAVAEYDTNYIFSLASIGGGRQVRDPIQAEANKIAKAYIAGEMKKKGKKLAELDKDKLAANIIKVAALPEVQKAAKDAVKARSNVGEASLVDLEF